MVDLNKGATVELVKALSDDIRTLPDGTKAASAGAAVRNIRSDLDALAAVMSVTSWEDVQKVVRSGIASKIFSIGDQLICQRSNVNLVWDVIGIDHDTPADPQFTHSLTLQLHDCFPTTMQFDAPEALYYCESELEAGTHRFTANGTNYQFTLESDIAVGRQLILNFTGNTPTSIFVSAEVGGDFVKDTNGTDNLTIAVTAGSGGDELTGVNDIDRVRYGSNNYKESAIRQWLNKSNVAGSVWTPQTDFDRPPRWHTGEGGTTKQAGFMNGMDADFLAAIGKTAKVTARNAVTDGGGENGLTKSDETDDYFFLLSRSEVYGGVEVSGVDEGEPYLYYAKPYSCLASAGTDVDSNRIKYVSGTVRQWWLRTPNSGRGSIVRDVITSGAVSATGPNDSYGVAPACNII